MKGRNGTSRGRSHFGPVKAKPRREKEMESLLPNLVRNCSNDISVRKLKDVQFRPTQSNASVLRTIKEGFWRLNATKG